MHVLFATNPALGHVLPLIPLARAIALAGHDVAVLGGASTAGAVETAELRHIVAGPPDLRSVIDRLPVRDGLSGRRLAAVVWKQGFAGILAPELAAATLELAETWRPDLVIHDDSEQGSWIAAERLGVPHLALQATAWRGTGLRLSADPLNRLRVSLGLPADPALERWHRHGYLATRPPSLLNPDDPPPRTSVPLRPVAWDEVGGEVPAWLQEPRPDGRARVAVTLGTMLPGRMESLGAMVAAHATRHWEVVAAVGVEPDPAVVGALPANGRLERWVPMSRLLAGSDVLVFHAGSGTMLAALSAGVPLVLLPVAADQPENADRCVAAGAGVALPPDGRSPSDVARATEQVLVEPVFRAAAGQVATEIAAMPAPDALVPRLEALAAAGADGVLAR
jgi:UDP:flavonoid glycosyltransferase YjiC (YdhE family)